MFSVFMMGSDYMGCWYVRQFLPMLVNGWWGSYRGLIKKRKPTNQIMQEAMLSDIVVFHRADSVNHHMVAMELKKAGKKIVFDNDDTYNIDKTHAFYNLDSAGFEQNTEYINNITNNFIRNADLVTTTNEFLAEEYRKLNPNVAVLPNCVNPDDWEEPLRNEGEKIRIGVSGSVAYAHDFNLVEDLLRKLDEDSRVQLVMFGLWKDKKRAENPKVEEVHSNEYAFWDTLKNLEHVEWVNIVDYFTTLNELRLDIMLIPRAESYFNKCKSNVKFLESAMCEIPCLVSSFKDAPYEKDIDGSNGRLIKGYKTEDWMNEINALINNKELRRMIGKNAYKYVVDNYNIHTKGHLWKDEYKKLCE